MSRSCLTLICCAALCVISFSLAGCLANQRLAVRGLLHGELVWQGDVFVAGDVTLGEDAKLTIMPGTRVRFMPPEDGPGQFVEHPHFPGSELIIKGEVHAIGTPAEPIVFEAVDATAAAGYWGGINLVGSQEAVFEYCLFRQADSAVHSWGSQVYIEQSIFEDNLVGVRFNDSEILVEHNLLRNNHTGVRFHFGSPVICENEFVGNSVNLFITSHPRDYHIENNSFGIPSEYQVVFGEDVPADVSMPRNFWIHSDPSHPERSFYDGQRSPYLGKVLVAPQRSSPSSQAGLSWSP